jgi:hypothetical protein
LNITGTVALAVFACDVVSTPRRRAGRWLAWLVMAVALAVLFILRGYLDSRFDAELLRIDDRPTFRFWHRTYLWVSTFQWAAAVGFTILSLLAWRADDRS